MLLYRQFLRLGNEAVDYRPTQKFVLRKVLRSRFNAPPEDPERVKNTLQFFKAAAFSNGLERRCLCTMIHVEASRHNVGKKHALQPAKLAKLRNILTFNDDFYQCIIDNINETQHMCL